MNPIIQNNLDAIRHICEECAVLQLFVFGSALTDSFGKKSDIDFLVEFDEPNDPVEFGLLLMNFEKKLAQLFRRKVDVVVYRYVQNPFFRKKLEQNKALIYDRRSQEASVGHSTSY